MTLSVRFAVILSTGGSVVKTLYNNTNRSEFELDLIVTDRECGGLEFGVDNKIEVEKISEKNGDLLSDAILKILIDKKIDYIYLFFTRLLKGEILNQYTGRIINFHPSLLPACPGLHGFEDTIKSGAMLAGSTAHYVDHGLDTGRIIYQSFTPTYAENLHRLRHIIFAQQCAMLHAIHSKLKRNESLFDKAGSQFDINQGFLPNLEVRSICIYKKLLGLE